MGISASISMTLDIEAGMASYVGAAGVGAACGAGIDAAIAAAIEGAFDIFCVGEGRMLVVSIAG